jgi:hypothetical protein
MSREAFPEAGKRDSLDAGLPSAGIPPLDHRRRTRPGAGGQNPSQALGTETKGVRWGIPGGHPHEPGDLAPRRRGSPQTAWPASRCRLHRAGQAL